MDATDFNMFDAALAARARTVETTLRRLLDDRPLDGEVERPAHLMDAIRHGVFNGGKRLRPFLVMEAAALFAPVDEAVARVAAAVECIHCYSLIHDDLPAMDDDDTRRGKPTVHKAFDEATAILAGDALLTFAFDLLASPNTVLSPVPRTELVLVLARASGLGGMVGGQALDLKAERAVPDEAGIVRLQAMKTGALIRAACEMGAIAGGAKPDERARLAEFGSAIGLAFQLADDLLDLTATPEKMGKATAKDDAAGKATLVRLHGADWTRRQLAHLTAEAANLLAPFGEKGAVLREAARFVSERDR
ncbi:MAG: polyprenyl synthetase family protein [Rhizobiaceae bacterium]|nr:polyprenyl synthetase family protein [Rhizobiaceae bacterium]MCV0404620.1 polyprenyl synthetase family protein [Rhizobiaceae bacterium]